MLSRTVKSYRVFNCYRQDIILVQSATRSRPMYGSNTPSAKTRSERLMVPPSAVRQISPYLVTPLHGEPLPLHSLLLVFPSRASFSGYIRLRPMTRYRDVYSKPSFCICPLPFSHTQNEISRWRVLNIIHHCMHCREIDGAYT